MQPRLITLEAKPHGRNEEIEFAVLGNKRRNGQKEHSVTRRKQFERTQDRRAKDRGAHGVSSQHVSSQYDGSQDGGPEDHCAQIGIRRSNRRRFRAGRFSRHCQS
ncbi:MAG TPA: hypothetical protein VN622_12080 [Clostridia bacterium]|nr:hypothetical protein [Clostridia bacterium]